MAFKLLFDLLLLSISYGHSSKVFSYNSSESYLLFVLLFSWILSLSILLPSSSRLFNLSILFPYKSLKMSLILIYCFISKGSLISCIVFTNCSKFSSRPYSVFLLILLELLLLLGDYLFSSS